LDYGLCDPVVVYYHPSIHPMLHIPSIPHYMSFIPFSKFILCT
jgi:hypothetical protein